MSYFLSMFILRIMSPHRCESYDFLSLIRDRGSDLYVGMRVVEMF